MTRGRGLKSDEERAIYYMNIISAAAVLSLGRSSIGGAVEFPEAYLPADLLEMNLASLIGSLLSSTEAQTGPVVHSEALRGGIIQACGILKGLCEPLLGAVFLPDLEFPRGRLSAATIAFSVVREAIAAIRTLVPLLFVFPSGPDTERKRTKALCCGAALMLERNGFLIGGTDYLGAPCLFRSPPFATDDVIEMAAAQGIRFDLASISDGNAEYAPRERPPNEIMVELLESEGFELDAPVAAFLGKVRDAAHMEIRGSGGLSLLLLDFEFDLGHLEQENSPPSFSDKRLIRQLVRESLSLARRWIDAPSYVRAMVAPFATPRNPYPRDANLVAAELQESWEDAKNFIF